MESTLESLSSTQTALNWDKQLEGAILFDKPMQYLKPLKEIFVNF